MDRNRERLNNTINYITPLLFSLVNFLGRCFVITSVLYLSTYLAFLVGYDPEVFTKWIRGPVNLDDIPGPKLKCTSFPCNQDELSSLFISRFTWQLNKIPANQETAGVGVYTKENGIYRGHCPAIFYSIPNSQILLWPTCPFNENDTDHLVVFRCYNYELGVYPGTYRILKTSQNPSLPIQYPDPEHLHIRVMSYTPTLNDDCSPLRFGEIVTVSPTGKFRIRHYDTIVIEKYIEKDVYISDFDHAFRKEVLPIEGTPLYQYLPSWTEERPDVNLIGRTLHERRKEILKAEPEAPVVSMVNKQYGIGGKLVFKKNCEAHGEMIGNKRAYISGFCGDLSNVEKSALKNKYITYNCYFHDSQGLPTFERLVIAAPFKIIDSSNKLKLKVSFTEKPNNCEIIWASKEKIQVVTVDGPLKTAAW